MTSVIHKKHRASIERIVEALQAQPPRVRSALTELRRVFERSGENPPALLAACAALLNTDDAVTPDVLKAVRTAHAEWDSYGNLERTLYSRCVFSTDSRHDAAAHEPNDVTVLLRENPPRITQALDRLRWLNAATQGTFRDVLNACANLLRTPSATHPTVVDAITTGRRLWPNLDQPYRALFIACVYASKERAAIARRRAQQAEQQRETQSGDIHRCGNCDANLSDAPDQPYCSRACRHEAEASERPTPHSTGTATDPEHEPSRGNTLTPQPDTALLGFHHCGGCGGDLSDTPELPYCSDACRHEARAADSRNEPPSTSGTETFEALTRSEYVDTQIDLRYDEQYRVIETAIPSAGRVRKDARVVDLYEGERQRHNDRDNRSDDQHDLTDATGRAITDEDYEREALRGIDPAALCLACNLARTPTEQRDRHGDGRCELCRERNAPPLGTFAPARALAAVA